MAAKPAVRQPIALTRHAEAMLVERQIKAEWVRRTIVDPDIVAHPSQP